MRLVRADIQGFARLVSTGVNLDSKVIAIVGPNEAGKTTLLKALAYLDSDSELPPIERSRAVEVGSSTTVVRVKFALNDDDTAALSHLELQDLPEAMSVGRTADGGEVDIRLEPPARKKVAPLLKPIAVIEKAVARKSLLTWVSNESGFGEPDTADVRDFRQELSDLARQVRFVLEGGMLNRERETEMAELGTALSGALVEDTKANNLRIALDATSDWFVRQSPRDAASAILWRRTPQFLLFDEADRTLRSSYVLDDELLAAIPAALQNLARMAALDLQALVAALRNGDIARRDTLVSRANNRLEGLFTVAWKQSALSVRLSVDGEVLRVAVIENDEMITVFDERSAGLRMFIALVAFLSTRDSEYPPVLLIDEAENHLHIDAQADLVNMFISQEHAARVIYTTHSPACLPPDLGVGIRAVVPSKDKHQISEIRNHFWGDGPGFSPLMIAMGAAAAAFTPARQVVLGEGATEMILLPSMLRSATGLDTLEYQVAPGLSEVPRDFYASLDLEGAKVAYLLDGDEAGRKLRDDLVASGVPEQRIVLLPVPGLENLLPAIVYSDAVAALMREGLGGELPGRLPRLHEPTKGPWAKQIGKWARDKGIVMPSKVAVASRIVANDAASPAEEFVDYTQGLHDQLVAALLS